MKCRGVAKGLLRLFHASCCKLLRCIPTPCFGFTVSQPFQDTKMFIKTSHSIENIEIHRNPWVTSRSARIVSKSWVNPMGHDASRALWEGITNWFRHVSSTSSSLSSHSRPKNAKILPVFPFFVSNLQNCRLPLHLNDRFCTVQAAAVNRPIPQWSSPVQSCPFRSEHVRTFLLDPRFVRDKNICAFGGLPEFVIGQSLLIPILKHD